MLDQLKTMFRSPQTDPSALPAATHSPARDAKLKGSQLTKGRTAAKVKSLVSEIETARLALARNQQVLGEKMVDGLDSATDMTAMNHAADHVRALEVALAVAIQKDDEAQRALAEATSQDAIAAEDEALAAFKASVLELEALLFGEMKLLVDKVGAKFMAVKDRSESDTGVMHQLGNFIGVYPVYLHRASSALISEGCRYIPDIDEKKKTLSAWADDVAYAMTFRRKGR